MRDRFHIDVPDMSHLIPIRISVSAVKKMSDAELLAALNGEDGRKGMMTMQFIQLITSELQARNIEKAGRPHWSTVPSFWLLVTSVILSIVAIVVAVIALPNVHQKLFPNAAQNQATPAAPVNPPPTKKPEHPAPSNLAPKGK